MAQTILVTGSTSGFGRLTVETLARQGYRVFAGTRTAAGKNAPGRDDGGCGLAPQGPAPAAAVSARASITDRPLEAAMSRHLALVTSKREATLKPCAEGIAWMRVLIDRANGTPASRGDHPVVVQTRPRVLALETFK